MSEPMTASAVRAAPVSAHKQEFIEGIKGGFPIGLGYFAVAFSLGIAACNAGFTPFQGFLTSILCNASAGQYAFFTQVAANAPLLEMMTMALITNARYLLMGAATSQKLKPGTSMLHRFLLGLDVTDELFGIEIARPGYLDPFYAYGAMLGSAPLWAAGTVVGIIAGNLLPTRFVSALSVALYGMFLAVIIPPAKTEKAVGACVLVSFAASYFFQYIPVLCDLSSGNKTILLTVLIAAAAAVLVPYKEDNNE